MSIRFLESMNLFIVNNFVGSWSNCSSFVHFKKGIEYLTRSGDSTCIFPFDEFFAGDLFSSFVFWFFWDPFFVLFLSSLFDGALFRYSQVLVMFFFFCKCSHAFLCWQFYYFYFFSFFPILNDQHGTFSQSNNIPRFWLYILMVSTSNLTDTLSITFIAIGDPNSNPVRGYLRFTSHLRPLCTLVPLAFTR